MTETLEQQFERYQLRPRLPQYFDHSTSGTFQECERMGYWRHILGRVPSGLGWALHWGKTVHTLVETWLDTRSVDACQTVIVDAIPEIVEDKYGRTRSRMVELFVEWVKYNETHPLKVLQNEQPVLLACLDQPCVYSDHGCGLTYGGRLDRVVNWQGITGPLDVKTSTMDEQDPVAEYKPSHQMEGYIWLASHLMGKHTWGVILEKIVCNKSKLRIDRYPVPYSKDNIREWAENEVQLQKRINYLYEHHRYEPSKWLQNHFRCYKPFKCSYRDVCLSPRDENFRFKFLRDNTVEAPWDFMDPNKTDEALTVEQGVT